MNEWDWFGRNPGGPPSTLEQATGGGKDPKAVAIGWASIFVALAVLYVLTEWWDKKG